MNGKVSRALRKDAKRIAKNLNDPGREKAVYKVLKQGYDKKS